MARFVWQCCFSVVIFMNPVSFYQKFMIKDKCSFEKKKKSSEPDILESCKVVHFLVAGFKGYYYLFICNAISWPMPIHS